MKSGTGLHTPPCKLMPCTGTCDGESTNGQTVKRGGWTCSFNIVVETTVNISLTSCKNTDSEVSHSPSTLGLKSKKWFDVFIVCLFDHCVFVLNRRWRVVGGGRYRRTRSKYAGWNYSWILFYIFSTSWLAKLYRQRFTIEKVIDQTQEIKEVHFALRFSVLPMFYLHFLPSAELNNFQRGGLTQKAWEPLDYVVIFLAEQRFLIAGTGEEKHSTNHTWLSDLLFFSMSSYWL